MFEISLPAVCLHRRIFDLVILMERIDYVIHSSSVLARLQCSHDHHCILSPRISLRGFLYCKDLIIISNGSTWPRCKVLSARKNRGLQAVQIDIVVRIYPMNLGIPCGAAGRRNEGQKVHQAEDCTEENCCEHYNGQRQLVVHLLSAVKVKVVITVFIQSVAVIYRCRSVLRNSFA